MNNKEIFTDAMLCDFMRIGGARILNPRAFNLFRTRNKLFSFERRLSCNTKSGCHMITDFLYAVYKSSIIRDQPQHL